MKEKDFSKKRFYVGPLYISLYRLSTQFVQRFYKAKPVLSALGVWDDDSLRRYFHFNSFKEVYDDAMQRNRERVELAEDIASLKGDDFWEPVRVPECKAASPRDEGFVFCDIPLAYDTDREKALKAISVKNCVFEISDSVLREQCYVEPSECVCECYKLVSDFCNKFNSLNFSRNFKVLFMMKDGKLQPNETGIMWGNEISPVF